MIELFFCIAIAIALQIWRMDRNYNKQTRS